MLKNDGVGAFYKGLSAGLLRQATYTTARLGSFRLFPRDPPPGWNKSFSWSFEGPPKGKKLRTSCKNKSKVGKKSFGKVTILIDQVVVLGAVAGEYTLLPESKSGSSRKLEIEFQWSNTTSSV